MFRQKWSMLTVAAIMLISILGSVGMPAAAGARGNDSALVGRVSLPQGMSPIALSGQDLGPLPGNTQIELAIVLPLRNQAALQTLIAAQNIPGSREYRHFLTPEQFLQTYSPTAQNYQTVVGYLQGNGFRVKTTPNRQLVIADGSASQAEQAFSTQLDAFKYDGKSGNYANVTPPSVPAALGDVIKGVQGLDSEELHSEVQGLVPSVSNSISPTGYTPGQIATAYDYPSLHGFDGNGKTIAVATSGDFKDSDLQAFDTQFGIKLAGYSRVYVQGHSGTPGAETTLDVEWSTALAKGADELVYEVPNAFLTSFTAEYNQIVTDNRTDVVTSSWGASELDQPYIKQDDGILEEGAAQGQSWFIASGDYGSYTVGNTSIPNVLYPASSPYVTATGATSLGLSDIGSIASETAWNSDGGASGGGTSIYETQPAWEYGSSYFSNGMRWLSDMAMDGDPSPGMDIVWKNSWYTVGGTSIVAPFASALAAEIAQYDNGRLGIFAARLNQLANSNPHTYGLVMHDITQGNNGYYNAGPGWDPPTGWGSPDGYELMLNYSVR